MNCEKGFARVTEGDVVIGFSYLAGLPYYRGLGLPMIDDIGLIVDGETMLRKAVHLPPSGRSWTRDEMETEYGSLPSFGKKAQRTVLKPDGLSPGDHVIGQSTRMRVSHPPFVPTTRTEKSLSLSS